MERFKLIKTFPGEPGFEAFSELPKALYNKKSPRFLFGHDPAGPHLEGCYVLLKDQTPIGRFAFYENPDLQYNDQPTACVGSYECIDDPAIGNALLKHALEMAAEKGYRWLIGSMEGSTWNSYRFSDHNDQPNFFLEPYHHAYYGKHFVNAGFRPIANYFSNLDHKIGFDEESLQEFEQLYYSKGAKFRNLNMDNLENDLQKIAKFTINAFSQNFLYTRITAEEFAAKYLELKKYFNPELVWLVENEQHQVQALSFSIKNYCDPSGKTIIVKSLARSPDFEFRGIGKYLIGKTYQVARQNGFTKAIHALMMKNNKSTFISQNKYSGMAYKSYTLYGMKT